MKNLSPILDRPFLLVGANRFRSQLRWLIYLVLSPWAFGAAFEGAPPTVWVSPDGKDTGPGTAAEPLRTFAAAQHRVREHPERGRQPIHVVFAAGTYYLPSAVVFTREDSGAPEAPVIYTAAPGAAVTLSGGQRLHLNWEPAHDGIWQAPTPAGLVFDQLFVNGRRQPMARYPNYDPEAQYFQGFAEDCTAPERVAKWANPAGGFLHAMHRALWGDMHWRITGKQADGTLALEGGWQNNRQMGAHQTFRFVENILEELDAPEEWYWDPDRQVLYYQPAPDVDPRRATFEAVRLRQLIAFHGTAVAPVRYLELRGFTLRHTTRTFMENREPLLRSDWTVSRSGAVLFQGAEDCALRDCHLDQVGGNAIFVDGYNRRIMVSGCRIEDAGASGVSFVGRPEALRSPLFEYGQTQTLEAMDHTPGPRNNDYPAECAVEDCLITGNGRVEKQTAGVNIAMADAITVRHCSIYDCPRAGINICDGAFGGHLIEFNDVFDTVKETGDHGSFNSWGRDRFWHPDRNVTAGWVALHPEMPKWDCRRTIVLRNNRWRCDHGWDIDLDDGSSNYALYNNLCLAGGIKLREGYFREVRNNIMVDWTFCPHVWYPDCHTRFSQNIVWQDGYRPAGMKRTHDPAAVDSNLVHRPGAEASPATGLQSFGGDAHSLVADAQFVDPAAGDYRVQPGSPALALGFENFPMDQFGVVSPELKRLARTPPLPGTLEAAGVRSGGWDREYRAPQTADWLGATLRNLEGMNDLSAVGLGEAVGVWVVALDRERPAARFGLRENDVILELDGEAVKDLNAFAKRLEQRTAEDPVELEVWRNQGKHQLRFTLPR